jgi:hypothetical protein
MMRGTPDLAAKTQMRYDENDRTAMAGGMRGVHPDGGNTAAVTDDG